MLQSYCECCGKDRKYKNLEFDEQLKGYCINPAMCNEMHPNALRNIKARGNVKEMLDFDQAKAILDERMVATYQDVSRNNFQRNRNMRTDQLSQAISFRLKNDIQAQFISYIMGQQGISKPTNAMHYIINKLLEADTGFQAQFMARQSNVASIHVPNTHIEPPAPARKVEKEIKATNVEEIFEV